MQNNAAVDHRIGAFLASTRYRSWQLNFRDDARRELAPLHQLGLDRFGLGLADEQLQVAEKLLALIACHTWLYSGQRR